MCSFKFLLNLTLTAKINLLFVWGKMDSAKNGFQSRNLRKSSQNCISFLLTPDSCAPSVSQPSKNTIFSPFQRPGKLEKKAVVEAQRTDLLIELLVSLLE